MVVQSIKAVAEPRHTCAGRAILNNLWGTKMDILFKNAPKIFIALLSLFLFGCQTMPAGWETSCGIGSSSYAQTEEGFSFGLKKVILIVAIKVV